MLNPIRFSFCLLDFLLIKHISLIYLFSGDNNIMIANWLHFVIGWLVDYKQREAAEPPGECVAPTNPQR